VGAVETAKHGAGTELFFDRVQGGVVHKREWRFLVVWFFRGHCIVEVFSIDFVPSWWRRGRRRRRRGRRRRR
jgi:hypothetical protein